jgi:TP901 family phage tail tape measure protein
MSDVNANISVNIDTSAALGELKNLQRQISQFHNQIAKSSASAAIAQKNLQQEFINSINSTGQFAARMQTIKTSAESFTNSLEKNKFSMREYFRYGVASSKTFGKVFRTEFDTINKVAEERVRKLQTQYIKMGRDASGAMKAIAVTPLALDMQNLGTKTMMAAQKQQLFNQLLAQGTTNLVNFGKNTQWAGRQLMVGFTIPLSIFGTTAAKAFMDLEKQVIRFKRVYGDLFTLPSETQANITVIRGLAQEFTKYGVSIADTMSIAADAAAAGFSGRKLEEQVKAATKLSVLGEVDKQQALSATIAMQTAFKMNSDQLAESINFLNAVENQSVVSLQNLTDAIPRVAPVIVGLGGDIKDMSVFLAAMQEGGTNAAEAANGLKSALASMINPSKAAREMLAGVNIDLNAITTRNEGNVMRTVLDLAEAMKQLTPLARQRILEQLFGKFQFARVSSLFENIAKSGSQAANALELVKMSSQDLAAIANKELSAIEENSATKFKSAVESLRASLAPVGEAFLKVVTPIIEFFTKIADKFNNLSDGSKKVVTTLVALFAGVGPVVLMLVGLIANFGGQMLKLFGLIRNGYLKLSGQSQFLGEQTQYLTSEQMQAEAVAHSLDQVHARLTQRFTIEADAVNNLRNAYLSATAAANSFAINNPGMMIPQSRQPKRFADGGVISGPGTGTSDSIVARVSNGEAIIPAKSVARHPDVVNALVSGNIPGFRKGLGTGTAVDVPGGFAAAHYGGSAYRSGSELLEMVEGLNTAFAKQIRTMVAEVEGGLDRVFTVFSNEVIATSTELNRAVGKTGSGKTAPIGLAKKDLIDNGEVRDIELQRQLKTAGVSVEDIKVINKKVTDNITEGFTKLGDITEVTANDLDKLINDAYTAVAKTDQRVEAALGRMKQVTAVTDPRNDSRVALSANPYTKFRKSGQYFEGMEDVVGEGNAPYTKNARFKITNDMAGSLGLDSGRASDVYNQFSNEVKVKLASLRGDIVKFTAEFERQAELAGLKTGRSYKVGIDKSNLQDVYVESRQRQSPHPFAKKDGIDDANAYEAARETTTTTRRRRFAASGGGTVGEGGRIIGPTGSSQSGNLVGGESPLAYSSNVMFGPTNKPTFRERLGAKASGFRAQPFKQQASTISRGAMSGGMVASGAMMAASMMPGKMGEMAQAAAPAVMGIQSLAMALPLLTNPIGLAVAGVAAVAAGFFYLRKKQQEYIKSLEDAGKKEAEARLGNIESINAYSRYVGDKALPAERQFNRQGDKRFISADLAKAANFRKFYAEEGKTIGSQLQGRAGKSNALDVTARDVAQRAATFGLAPADIAANIKAAAELSGVSEIKLKGKVQELLNKDGKDITKDPLTIDARINYLSKASETSLAVIQRKIDQIRPVSVVKTEAYAESGSLYDANVAGRASEETRIKNTKFATVGLTLALEDQKNSLAILNAQYVDGKITVEEYNAAYEAQMVNFRNIKKATDDLVKSLDKVDPSGKASQAAIADMADATFKSLEKTNKRVAKLLKETVTKSLPKNMRTSVLVAYAEGSLSATDILQLDILLSDMKGKTYEQKLKIVGDLTGISDALQAQLDYALATENLSIAQEKYRKAKERGSTALEKYKKNLDNAKGSVEKLKKAIEEGGKVTKDSPEVPGTTGIKDTDTGSKTNPNAFIDDLLKKLKEVRKNSIDATKGVSGFIAALKGDLTGFKGTNELLRASGATQGFIDIVGGLDAKTFKAVNGTKNRLFTLGKDGKMIFGDLGKAIQKFTKEVELGNFVDQQQDVGRNAAEQIKAYNKMASAGLSAAKITEILGNEALTAAVAAESVGSQDFKTFIAGAKSADSSIKGLAKTLKVLAFQDAQDKETAADKMDQYFAAQEAIIKQQSRAEFTRFRGTTPEEYERIISKQQESVDLASKAVEEEQSRIDGIQDLVSAYNRGIELISREEEKINKAYEERSKAIDDQITGLEDVKKVNQQLIDQQKQQTDLAGALSSGDIGAAAKIAQEMRANSGQNSQQNLIDNLGKRKTALEVQKQKELSALQTTINGQVYNRTQLQDLILKKEDEIYLAENTTLKVLDAKLKTQETILGDMQRIIDKYNKDMTDAINNVKNNVGQTKAEWDTVKTAVEAVTEWLGDAHMLGTMDDVAAGVITIESAWKKVLAAIEAANAAAAAGGAGGSGGANQKQAPPPITSLNKDQKAIIADQSSVIQSLVKSGDINAAEKATVSMMAQVGAIKVISSQDVVATRKAALGYLNSGGIVPKYFASGGYARGADTIPAMLTPGEFIMSKYAVNQHGLENLQAMNNGETPGGSVYTYNLSVNVKSDANPNEIARTVMTQIKQIDSQRLRGIRK